MYEGRPWADSVGSGQAGAKGTLTWMTGEPGLSGRPARQLRCSSCSTLRMPHARCPRRFHVGQQAPCSPFLSLLLSSEKPCGQPQLWVRTHIRPNLACRTAHAKRQGVCAQPACMHTCMWRLLWRPPWHVSGHPGSRTASVLPCHATPFLPRPTTHRQPATRDTAAQRDAPRPGGPSGPGWTSLAACCGLPCSATRRSSSRASSTTLRAPMARGAPRATAASPSGQASRPAGQPATHPCTCARAQTSRKYALMVDSVDTLACKPTSPMPVRPPVCPAWG